MYWDNLLRHTKSNLYQVWEYWGWISKAKKIDIDVGGYATVPSIGIANGPKNK